MTQIKIICFESTDGAGKSSVIAALNKKSKYKYICIDRFLGSSFCYRRNKEEDLLKAESILANLDKKYIKFYLVYLYCSNNRILIKRLQSKKDEDKIKYIKRDKKRYKKYLSKTKFDSIAINTSYEEIDKTVDRIIKFVEEAKI